MATQTTIEWTHTTWNPVTGCTKVSAGCKNCYAERMAHRLRAMGQERYRNGFKVTLQPQALDEPRRWRKPRLVFVNSMSDLFHRDVPVEFIVKVFETMASCPQHTFQVLTKRSERLRRLAPELPWPSNVWMGVSVENQKAVARIVDLVEVPAAVRFLSVEPLLGPLDELSLDGIGWVIVGGESGPGARPMEPSWVVDIRDGCLEVGVPFFFKQWGGVNKKKTGRQLEGRTWDEMPEVREVGPPADVVAAPEPATSARVDLPVAASWTAEDVRAWADSAEPHCVDAVRLLAHSGIPMTTSTLNFAVSAGSEGAILGGIQRSATCHGLRHPFVQDRRSGRFRFVSEELQILFKGVMCGR